MRVIWPASVMRTSQKWVLVLLFSLMILQIPDVESKSGGIDDVVGCTCHNVTPTESVIITLEGLPERYEPNKTYTLNFSAENGTLSNESSINSGGFNLWISHGVLTNITENVQVFSENEVGHTTIGNDQRAWVVNWTAPKVEGVVIEYRLLINTVNGDGIPSPADQWNLLSGTINEEIQEPVSNLFLFGVPIVLILLAGGVYVREMNKLRTQAAAEEE